ncbi:MAG TPA: lipoprotein insertase outer membrane protein LolB [Gammaproteobacteria bacterium]|nr:lipoprotein insertase outer membrane protein LolB [Gammaproteobacteria bacterium]
MTRRQALVATALALGALSGCAHVRPGDDAMTYAQRRDFLAALDSWELRGRIAIDNGQEAFQGRFQWSQRPDGLALTVRSPLGTSVLRVSGPEDRLTLEARGESRELTDPEYQLSAMLGWWLPVTSFKSWLLGMPDPGYGAREALGADGRLATLQQRLWQLSYASYQLMGGVLLPRRIDLTHEQLEFRVFVDSWAPAP